ncbi:mediator of RNA polymerase II transcription subunit 1 isoform X1 [Alosa alosa]|uniref:mediator of RNA polymerase II transcription subunit 1 isoform X1 n=1 Tax=Alosa alosa TaxID=278164 RepID=UPI0020155490|nr:mediator of RNA polymerase II transcription subunit 1 isoform X1 [Alosa alosa]
MLSGASGKSLVADVTSKFAEKPWNETFQLVRRCMGKFRIDPTFSKPLSGCLQRLQEALNVSSLNAMVSRLEVIAKQRGLGSHLSPTETACYLTADLFYLEVLLKPDGGVEDVKVALHGEAPVSNKLLLQLLRQKLFVDFSTKLNDLSSLYNIPGDNDIKVKVCTALQFMEKDLLTISHMPRSLRENDVYIDTVLNGRVGKIVPSGPGTSMKIQYAISPSNRLLQRHCGDIDGLTQDAFVMLGPSENTHRLQLASLIPSPPQIDSQGFPLFSPLKEVASESLPATFILRLQPAVGLRSSVIHQMEKITDVKPEADQQWEPLLQLLMRSTLGEKGFQESWNPGKEANFLVALPGNQVHGYVLSGPAWSASSWKGALIDTIPFTHPAHVPLLLELLRHQSALNILLASCIKGHQHYPEAASSDLYCEVLPESDSSFSIMFLLPGTSSLAVLFVTVIDICQVHCQLFAPKLMDAGMNDYISRVMTRCMSIPITMRAIYKSLINPIFATDPEISTSPHEVNTTVSVVVDHSLPPAPDLHTGSSKTESPGSSEMVGQTGEHLGPVPPSSIKEEDPAMCPSPSPCYVMALSSNQEVSDSNTEATANPYPLSSVCVFPHWSASGHVAELV